jgi:transposase
MPRERVSMRKIREVLRLKWGLGLSERQVAQSCDMGRSTVSHYLERAEIAGLTWPLPEDLDDVELEAKLFKTKQQNETKVCPSPNWENIHQELKSKGVTLKLLWREYLAQNPEGYSYCTFSVKYREWKQGINVTMRQDHKAGEKLFVDYAGMTVPIVNPSTGEIKEAQVFVAVLGASNYTYAEVTQSQKLEDWLASHRRAFEFFGWRCYFPTAATNKWIMGK